jgi:hypothetical protein
MRGEFSANLKESDSIQILANAHSPDGGTAAGAMVTGAITRARRTA